MAEFVTNLSQIHFYKLNFFQNKALNHQHLNMPPKKEAAPEKKILLGRPGNTLKMGIVGLPNVGKSSTFNLLSKLNVPAENFPFCTIEPNVAKVAVPDPRFDKLCEMWKPKSQVPAVLNVIDIAGLVPGAHEGAGLGNAFLSHIQGVDGIFQVVRAFEDDEITHTEGDVNPVRDLEIISIELIKKDLQQIVKKMEDLDAKIKRNNDKDAKEEKEVLTRVVELLNTGKWIRMGEWKARDVEILNTHLFLTAKPVVYLVNLSEKDYKVKHFFSICFLFLNLNDFVLIMFSAREINGLPRSKTGLMPMVVALSFLTLLIMSKNFSKPRKKPKKAKKVNLNLKFLVP